MPKRHVLLLTATITPPIGVPQLVRVNPDDRREDYRLAFRKYAAMAGSTFERIILAENSASDLSDFETIAKEMGVRDLVEFHTFQGLDHPPSYGRAYGELKLIEHTVDHSATLSDRDPNLFVWKMTGRYRVNNLDALVRKSPKSFDLYCNLRNLPSRWMDMYLMGWSWKGYDEFLRGIKEHMREDLLTGAPELEMRHQIDKLGSGIKVVPRFRQVPIIDGIRGYDGKNYSEGVGKWKLVARRVSLKVLPLDLDLARGSVR